MFMIWLRICISIWKNVPAIEPSKGYQIAVNEISHTAMVVNIKLPDKVTHVMYTPLVANEKENQFLWYWIINMN